MARVDDEWCEDLDTMDGDMDTKSDERFCEVYNIVCDGGGDGDMR